MFTFISYIWNKFWRIVTALRNGFFNAIFLLIIVAVIVSIATAPSDKVPNETALYVAPKGYLVDQRTYTPTAADIVFGNSDRVEETPLRELVDSINKAAEDKRITALILHLDHFVGGGLSKMEELGQALEHFKAQKKPIYAYADQYSQQQYFLASYADTIYMTDMGNLLLTGFGSFRNYFKDAADKLSVKFHVFRVGDYKDAVEPFMRNNMSTASREHNSRWLNELWQRYTQRVTHNRNLSDEAITDYINALSEAPNNRTESLSELALQVKLVDELLPRNAIKQALAKLVGKEEKSEDYKSISFEEYIRATKPALPSQNKDTIGLIVASGNILDGEQNKGSIGGDSLSLLIEKAREDDSLKALVIRVNSGGGSAFASEIIRQEILTAKEAGLPIYISMGSVAASGGYWISTAAQEIWATPSTITGSIGVWGLIPNVSGSIERMGIHSDGVGTTTLSDVYHIDRQMSGAAKNLIQSGVNDVYTRFLNIVAEARDSDPASVNEIAGGRVWTGETAKTLGLVDNLGSLNDLFQAIASTESLTDYRIKVIEKPLTPSEEFVRAIMEEVSQKTFNVLMSHSSGWSTLINAPNAAVYSRVSARLAELVRYWPKAFEEGQQPATMAVCMECYSP